MDNLPHRFLATLSLDVDLGAVVGIGAVPGGTRMIAPVADGRLEGDRISATVRPGHAWLNHALIVGVGEQVAAGPVYRLYEIG